MPAKRDDITDEGVQKLASYGCTQDEVAKYFGCSPSLIGHKYAEAFALGHSSLHKSLRMWQVRNARKGSDKMLIHLGQQYLGQSQKVETTQRQDPAIVELPELELHADQTTTGTTDEVPSESS